MKIQEDRVVDADILVGWTDEMERLFDVCGLIVMEAERFRAFPCL
jgi:hypothetical protein